MRAIELIPAKYAKKHNVSTLSEIKLLSLHPYTILCLIPFILHANFFSQKCGDDSDGDLPASLPTSSKEKGKGKTSTTPSSMTPSTSTSVVPG